MLLKAVTWRQGSGVVGHNDHLGDPLAVPRLAKLAHSGALGADGAADCAGLRVYSCRAMSSSPQKQKIGVVAS